MVPEGIQSTQVDGNPLESGLAPVKVTQSTQLRAGNYACPAAFHLDHLLGISPREVTDAIIAHCRLPEYVSSVDQHQHYLNFGLAGCWLQRQVAVMLWKGAAIAQEEQYTAKRIQIECISADPTGPLTMGRSHGGIVGDTLAWLLCAQIHHVESENCCINAGR